MTQHRPTVAQIDGSAPVLSSLAPEYSFEAHGVYFTILKATIDKQPEVRNIALAGTYGTGKSSILREIARVFGRRVVELSLLTLGVRAEATVPIDEANSAATTPTNLIQKEIVKQLLYQQRPAKAPASRFRRIVRFQWGTELLLASLAGVLAVLLALLVGLDIVVSPTLGITFSDRPQAFAVVALFLVVGLVVGTLTLAIRALVRGRASIESVSAGPATITLPPRSASYFDEYLDEIIYFFETNTKVDIVIIEDLDRFNDPNIFESLRSLNSLLNAAKQLDHRNIRFIYAVRDSVFEKLGRKQNDALTDEARAELIRANRTKFFELVIPVVPFITHKNARDLMASLLESHGHTVSKDLVDLAARHVADMRLIHNIINEFAVFRHRLLDVSTPVPGLDTDRLFAMILFKNAHMADFENVRHGASSLDTLWDEGRNLVRVNIDRLRQSNRELRLQIDRRTAAAGRAAEIAKQLRLRIDVLVAAPGSAFASPTIQYGGADVTDEMMRLPSFWRQLIQENLPLTMSANAPAYSYGPQIMQISREQIEVLTGLSIDLDDFHEEVAAEAEETILRNDESIALLRRQVWSELAASSEFSYAAVPERDPYDFRTWAEQILPSRLAADLVIHGYITSYFALHVSTFYGTLIRPDAMTYVMRFVDHGIADADYPLDGEDVEAILRDQGSTVLVERSMFNIGIVDHLLVARPLDALTVLKTLLGNEVEGQNFINRYLESGAHTSKLIALLTPLMPSIFAHLLTTSSLASSDRTTLLESAIVSRASTIRYDFPSELRLFVEENYRDFSILLPNASREAARKGVKFLKDVGAVIPSLLGLSESTIAAVRATRSYSVTRENFELVSNSLDISLDELAKAGEPIVEYAMDSAKDFARAFSESATTEFTVVSSGQLIRFLQVASYADEAAIETVVSHAAPACIVPSLNEVPELTWSTLARNKRVPMTFANVTAYIDGLGMVDDHLGVALASAPVISNVAGESQSTLVSAALAILNSPASSLKGSHRVELAESLKPGQLLADQISPIGGSMIGDLIAAGLIADDANAFSSRLMVDWETQAHAILRSTKFTEFVNPTTLDAKFIQLVLRDATLAASHLSVVRAMVNYPDVPLGAYEAYADLALAGAFLPGARGIAAARQAGLNADIIVRLLAKFIDRVSVDELRPIVRLLGKPWSNVADPGFGVTAIPDSESARVILGALQRGGVVSKFPERNGQLHVSLRQK